MILLKELKIKDFLSHEKTEIDFNENEKILIDGRSGSGKSSIIEAILWVLYSKGRVDNRSLVRKGAKNGAVSLKLIDGARETIITRTISAAGKSICTVTQNTGSTGQFIAIQRTGLKDIQEWIEKEFLKASYELFTNSVAYPQDNENSFVKANASDRKDLLLEIVRAGNFDKLYEKARKALSENTLDNAVNVSKIDILEKVVKDKTIEAKTLKEYTKDAEKSSIEIEKNSILMKDLEKKIEGISVIFDSIVNKKLEVTKIEYFIEETELQLKKDANLIAEHDDIKIGESQKKVKEGDKLSEKVNTIEKKLKDNTERQMKINAHLANKPPVSDPTREIELINTRLIPLVQQSGECPAKDKCPFVIPIKGQITFLTEQITAKTKKRDEEEALLAGWDKLNKELTPSEDTNDLYKELVETKDKINVLYKEKEVITKYELFSKTLIEIKERKLKAQKDLEKAKIDLLKLEEDIKALEKDYENVDSNQINLELSGIRILIQELQKIKDEASAGMIVASRAKIEAEGALNELSELQAGVSKALEDKVSLELIKEAFSPRGIKAVVIDYLVPQLEEAINNVLGQMSDFQIRLDTQKTKADDEGVKEGLFIIVINDKGEEMDFANYSGGERVKITIAISEALASLMSDIGFRIMDENIVSLDKESTEGFVEVLTGLQEKFPQLLIISHLQEVKDMFEKQINVTKKDGISKII